MKNKIYWVICICPLWLFLSNCVDKFNAHMNYSSGYTDIMLFKKQDSDIEKMAA